MECKHKYIGSSDGVTCAFCGAHWTHEEYVALFDKTDEAAAPETKKRGRPRKQD